MGVGGMCECGCVSVGGIYVCVSECVWVWVVCMCEWVGGCFKIL